MFLILVFLTFAMGVGISSYVQAREKRLLEADGVVGAAVAGPEIGAIFETCAGRTDKITNRRATGAELLDFCISGGCLPDMPIDLMDDASVMTRTEINSPAQELDAIHRRVMQLETLEATLKREKDCASREFLEQFRMVFPSPGQSPSWIGAQATSSHSASESAY